MSTMELLRILSDLGISPAEYAVIFHVRDTVVIERAALATWASDYLPNNVPQDISHADCVTAIDTLIQRGLLVELTAGDIEADLARWRAETIPVSWGVDRRRDVSDVDLTDAGFLADATISRLHDPGYKRGPMQGYNDDEVGVVRVFGETEAACVGQVTHFVGRIDQAHAAITIDPIHPIGPWWYSRFERIPCGFEIIVRIKRP